MHWIGILLFLGACISISQASSDFKPASSKVLDAQYPIVDSNSRVQIRFKAPETLKVRINFSSGPKADTKGEPDNACPLTNCTAD